MQTQTVSTNQVQHSESTFLRRALQGNALFSLVTGLAFTFAAGPIARFIGPDIPTIIVLIVGLGLLPFSYLVLSGDCPISYPAQPGPVYHNDGYFLGGRQHFVAGAGLVFV